MMFASLNDCEYVMLAGIALMVLGGIAIIPGFYFTRIAYYAWRGSSGYSLTSIPDV